MLEGGINRNSNPQAINTVRHNYDRFLAKFPLLFGYWKKYADLEFSITGTEAAEMVWHHSSPVEKILISLFDYLFCFNLYPEHEADSVILGLRTWYCQYLSLCRPLDQLLRLQGRDFP